MRYRAAIVSLVLAGAVHGQSFDRLQPELGSRYIPKAGTTEEGLWMSVGALEEQVKHSPTRITNPELNAYVTGLVCRIVMAYCTDIRVYLLREPSFNAMMAPNGMMIIHSGLMLRSRNEAQLVAVIGHELGHYLRRHSLKQFENLKSTNTFATILGLGLSAGAATGNVDPNLASGLNDLSQFALLAGIFHYSREQEREADQYGVQLMSDVGLNTLEAAAVWRHLIAEESSEGKQASGSMLFSTHPASDERMEQLEQYAQLLQPDAVAAQNDDIDQYHEIMRPHTKSWIEDELNLHQFGRSVYVLNGLLENGTSPGLVNFFLGELYRKRREEGDNELSREYYQIAMDLDSSIPELHRALGMLHLKEKNHDTANAYFNNYLELSPDSKDRKMIEFYLSMKKQP